MKDCIFCKIIKGDIPSYKIFEDKWTYSFLDISNDGNGHILVVPKKHYKNILDVDSDDFAYVMEAVRIISKHLVDECGFSGVNIVNANGEDAEQSVGHLHFHILPRKKDDGMRVFPQLNSSGFTMEELQEKFKIENKKVILYTDGACSGNPGLGGWGAILIYNGKEKILSGGEENTTNNRMEMMAVIKGLKALKQNCEVDVYSDSAYVVNTFQNGWIDTWQNNGWRTSKGDVLNIDLWQELLNLLQKHNVIWHKVKGHSTDENNNRCDALARKEIEKMRKKAD